MKKLIIFASIGLITLFSLIVFQGYEREKIPEDFLEVQKTMNQCAKIIGDKYCLEAAGTGISRKDLKISGITIRMYKESNYSIDEIRPVLLDCVNIILHTVNENKNLKPFLYDSPFTTKNVSFSIGYTDKEFHWLEYPFIGSGSIYHGIISYSANKINNKGIHHSITILEETLEEALEKQMVAPRSNSFNKTANHLTIKK